MFDYFKAYTYDRDFALRLRNNSILDFYTPVNDLDGSFKNSIYVADFQNLEFKIYPKGKIELKGSLHKYYNLGVHNYNDFDFVKLDSVLKELIELFKLDLSKWRVNHLEFGLNINTRTPPKDILNNLIVYKYHPFENVPVPGNGNYKRCNVSQYSIKMYDKGSQYCQPGNILRIEKKAYKMECIRKGPTHLSDLIDPSYWSYCLKDLIDGTKQIIISEELNEKLLSVSEKEQFRECINSRSWQKWTSKKRCKNRSFMRKILSVFGTNHYLDELVDAVYSKGERLSNWKGMF